MKKCGIYFLFFLMSSIGFADWDISFVEKAIEWVNPRISSDRVSRYAAAIMNASERFGIDPITLIAIAQQESSFRENLPLGPAGEVGMLQIQQSWLQNKKFRRVFKKFTHKHLKNPETAFMAAAWILSDIRRSTRSEKLPYWTYYNARQFKNRLKYHQRVNRHLSKIELKRARYARVLLATSKTVVSEPVPQKADPSEVRKILEQTNWQEKAIEVLKTKNPAAELVAQPLELLKKGIVSLLLPHES